MINKIIKDWVGEEIFYQGTYLNKVGRINGWEEEAFLRGRENGYNQALQYLTSRIPQLTERIEKEMEVKISQLRQWLNEDRIDNPKKMITNEDIKHWLEFTNHTLTREVREE